MLAVEVKTEAKVTPPNSSSPKDPGPLPFAPGIRETVSPYVVWWTDLRDLDSYDRPSTKEWEGVWGGRAIIQKLISLRENREGTQMLHHMTYPPPSNLSN